MVFCTYCGNSFTREEHLERHILTHTNIKPFKCFTCHMSFARRDLLQRHYIVHGKNQDSRDGSTSLLVPKSAGRTPIACTNCAKTKTKCDRKSPCSRCSSRNLKCILRSTRRISRQPGPSQIQAVDSSSDTCSTTSSEVENPIQAATPAASISSSPQPQLSLPTNSPLVEALSDSLIAHQSQLSIEESQKPSATPSAYYQHLNLRSQSLPVKHTTLTSQSSPDTTETSYITDIAMSDYREFTGHYVDAFDQWNPRFMMEWNQLPTSPEQMLALSRANMVSPMGMTTSDMTNSSIFAIMPEYVQSVPSHDSSTTSPTPSTNGTPSDFDARYGSIAFSNSTRKTSTSDFGLTDHPAVILGQDSWNCFRSAPTLPLASIPKTAKLHIEKLEQSLKCHDGWNGWASAWQDTDTSNDHLAVLQLQECSKDKLLAITQSFLQKALQVQRGSSNGTEDPPIHYSSNFILLPPVQALTYFLRSYANTFEHFYPMSSCGALDMNRLIMPQGTERAASLLTLMMIASGALSVSLTEARWLSGGLIEACRLSLFDLVERQIATAFDPVLLHAALLFTTTAAWSGDKWHMDTAMSQRGWCISILRHCGALEQATGPPRNDVSPEQLHAVWLQQESMSRLVYSWAILDQDIALFHDVPALFSVTEFGAPMPDSDILWHATTTSEWSASFSKIHEFSGGVSAVTSGVRPLSLKDMFRHLLENDIVPRGMDLTPLQLRLLLHPLQSLVFQYRQLSSCFSENVSSRQQSSNVHTQSMRARQDELQALLKRWRQLVDRYASSHPLCPLMQATMIIFHLISLNTVTSFAEIEKLARKEDFDGSYVQIMWKHKRCITDVEEAVYHCGQVIRLIKGMPVNVRPPWWTGAIYRVGLILWVESLAHSGNLENAGSHAAREYIGIDAYTAEHPVLARFRSKKEGLPALTRRDSMAVPIEDGFAVLSHCLEIIDEGIANRFSDGIRNKLEKLAATRFR